VACAAAGQRKNILTPLDKITAALLSLSPDRIKQEDEKEENQSSALFIIAILSLRFEFHIAETNSFYLVLLGETG
jgi:hypothetical protein